jgi:hypothetical protein
MLRQPNRQRLLLALAALACSACVAPSTQLNAISPADLEAEQLKQQQLVIRGDLRDQQRIEDVGYPLLKAALPMCGPGAKTTRSGLRFANVHTFSKQYQPAARAMGFTDTLTVVGVARGSAADRGGIAIGDRLVGLGTIEFVPGRNATQQATDAFERAHNRDADLALTVRRGSLALAGAAPVSEVSADPASLSITLPADTLCNYTLTALKDDALNAFADGRGVFVTSSMLRFAATDDELATVLAHEIAHNAMKHMDAESKNAGIGALFGAIIDIAAASQGVNTGGGFTKDFAALGARTFSQDFEREADYVGMYILARGGRPFASAADFRRRMAQESPGSIKFASSHPTTAERYLRLDQAAAEIQQKQAAQTPLFPETKKK